MKFKYYLLCIGILITGGCTTVHHGHYAVLSPVEITDKEYELVEKDGYGEDKSIYWAFSSGRPTTVDGAVKNALELNGGAFLKNVDIYFKMWMVPLIWGEYKMVVEGEIWREKETIAGSSE